MQSGLFLYFHLMINEIFESGYSAMKSMVQSRWFQELELDMDYVHLVHTVHAS